MSTNVKEVASVKALSRYGFQTTEGVYYNWSKNIKEEDKGKVIPGASFEMDLFIADSGKKYVNSVSKQVSAGDPPSVATAVTRRESTPPVRQAPTVGRDFDKEARGKTFCQYLSAVLSNSAVNFEDIDKLFPMIDRCVARTFGDDKTVGGDK